MAFEQAQHVMLAQIEVAQLVIIPVTAPTHMAYPSLCSSGSDWQWLCMGLLRAVIGSDWQWLCMGLCMGLSALLLCCGLLTTTTVLYSLFCIQYWNSVVFSIGTRAITRTALTIH